jgi:CDP-glucose 4,6-dehydratase
MEKMVDLKNTFNGKYTGKRVLVTGHTGFKGSWLSLWLRELGAEVCGFSKYIPSEPSFYEVTALNEKVSNVEGDVRNFEAVKKIFQDFKPEIVFHLAAQPIVRTSYDDPKLTFETNLLGTVNVLETIRNSDSVKSAVIITSDKCYENVGWDWGYRETDRLGGPDPYSASKACAEIAFSAYARSYFLNSDKTSLATARAGNVIGGGDWAVDRIVPDCVRAWSEGRAVKIRNPNATRPWLYVLEPLSGYLWLGASLLSEPNRFNGESFNFAPNSEVVSSVRDLAGEFALSWENAKCEYGSSKDDPKEATLLKLSYDKALRRLEWRPALSFKETVAMTAKWYKSFYNGTGNIQDYSVSQIKEYTNKAVTMGISWAGGIND